MSRTRPPNFLQNWASLPSSPTILTYHPRSLLPITNPIPRNQRQHPLTGSRSRQPFHSTPPSNAARSPAARRYKENKSKPVFSSEALDSPVQGSPNSRLQFLEKNGLKLMGEMLYDGIIDASVTPKTFMSIARTLLENAYSQGPSASAVEEIHDDVDLIFEIGRTIARDDIGLTRWITTSCTLAGARIPLFLSATQYLNTCHNHNSILFSEYTSPPKPSRYLTRVENLATTSSRTTDGGEDDRDPLAMLIHAKVLGLRGNYGQALTLVEGILRRIRPSTFQIPPNEDLTLSGRIEPPWELYLWLNRAMRKTDASSGSISISRFSTKNKDKVETDMTKEEEDMTRLAALEYEDPTALITYATIMRERGDMKKYEECMGKAAASGNRHACRKLGNFYYLTSLGEIPRIEDKRPFQGFFSALSSYFGPRPLPEYRSLAIEWYRVGLAHKCLKSGTNLAILYHQDKDFPSTVEVMETMHEMTEGFPELQAQARRVASFLSVDEIKIDVPLEDLDL